MITYEANLEAIPPLSPDVEALIQYERVLSDKPEIMRARLMARAREALRAGNNVAVATRRPSSTRMRPLWLAAAAGILLIASVAAAVQMLRIASPAAPARPSLPEHKQRVLAPVEQPEVESAPEPLAKPASLPRVSRTDAVEELRLLERAHQAEARGDYASVLGLTAEHERRFVRGRLAEDREVLRIRAFVGLGRGNDARVAAAKFRRQFPRSVLLQKVDDLLARPH